MNDQMYGKKVRSNKINPLHILTHVRVFSFSLWMSSFIYTKPPVSQGSEFQQLIVKKTFAQFKGNILDLTALPFCYAYTVFLL